MPIGRITIVEGLPILGYLKYYAPQAFDVDEKQKFFLEHLIIVFKEGKRGCFSISHRPKTIPFEEAIAITHEVCTAYLNALNMGFICILHDSYIEIKINDNKAPCRASKISNLVRGYFTAYRYVGSNRIDNTPR
ncbi:hypothetical protein K0U07_00685 [bacterium]|nr:hypothetical protein [bacterium]